jgi:large subunit ribosomal protein L9
MRVVLRDDVSGVGRRGDIVEVAGGFARNFLFPSGRALRATSGIEEQASAMRRSRDLREARDREAAETKARVLAGATVTVAARAGASGRLFGSVGPTEVAEAAREQLGVQLEPGHVALGEHLKEVGNREVTVELHRDVVTVMTVDVVPAR